MEKPVLVVMAAGLGSRYGGLKQIDPVGPHGQCLLDYALFDAYRAGFEDALFIISPQMEAEFPKDIQERVQDKLRTRCVVQRTTDIPAGHTIPEGRTKPWGTAQAIYACRDAIQGPFAAVNADDFYGPGGYVSVFNFLSTPAQDQGLSCAMVGYSIQNTLSDHGYVARGVCKVNENNELVEIIERTHLIKTFDGPLYTEDGQLYHRLPSDAAVSMNFWGFKPGFIDRLGEQIHHFMETEVPANPLKAEIFLPNVVGSMVKSQKITAHVLPCHEQWYGVTYHDDKPRVSEAITRMTAKGMYPENLWA